MVHKHIEDWHINSKVLDRTIEEIKKRVHIDREHSIPYVAGYSKDGKTIYIDKDMPEFFIDKRGKKILIDNYLILHEAVEKALLDELKLLYQHAHQIAVRTEREAIEADGIDWDEYNTFMEKWIKEISHDTKNVPKDLDLTPYKDEKDFKLLQQMTENFSLWKCLK